MPSKDICERCGKEIIFNRYDLFVQMNGDFDEYLTDIICGKCKRYLEKIIRQEIRTGVKK
jgi:hypothetical protein